MDQNDPAPSHVQLGRRLAEEDPQAHQNVVQAMSSFFENRQAEIEQAGQESGVRPSTETLFLDLFAVAQATRDASNAGDDATSILSTAATGPGITDASGPWQPLIGELRMSVAWNMLAEISPDEIRKIMEADT